MIKKALLLSALTVALAGCGGSESNSPSDIVSNFQTKLNGPGGIWFGAFVEQEQTADKTDNDMGGMYLDISKDIAGSIKGGMSYQTLDCQKNSQLNIDAQKTKNNLQLGLARGDLEPAASASGSINAATTSVAIQIKGSYQDKANSPKPWSGSFDATVVSKDITRVIESCNKQTYTQADNGVWSVYPADSQFGITLSYNKNSNVLSWTPLANAGKTLIYQLEESAISGGKNAFIKQLVQLSNLTTFVPQSSEKGKSVVVVQVFDAKNKLIGFDALSIAK